MFGVKAKAVRTPIGVVCTIAALLENACKRAEIIGTYPGSVFHFVDPGHAEVFINEYTLHGLCIQHVVPWSRSVLIPDFPGHTQVNILVNDHSVLMVPIDAGPVVRRAEDADWIVTALVGAPAGGPYFDCAVHHKDDIILAIYQVVFGPASKADCNKFIQGNCRPHTR